MIWVLDAWGATITGRVSGPEGPIARATVIAYDRDFDYHYDTTDGAGEFAIADVEDRKWRIRVIPPAESPAAEAWVGGPLGPCGVDRFDGTSDVDVGDIVLALGVALRGRILDADGAPVPGVDVSAVHAESDSTFVSRQATTADDGTWTILGIPPGEVAVRLAPDLQPVQWLPGVYASSDAERITLDGAEDVGDMSLLPGITVGGSVSGPDGPIGAGTVTVYVPSALKTVPVVDGRFLATGLPPGRATAWARVDGYGYTYWPDRDRAGEWIDVPEEGGSTDAMDLLLPRQSTVTGRMGGEGDLSGGAVLLWNDDYTVGLGAPLSADGSFEVARLHPGAYQLVLFGSGVGYVDDVARDVAGSPLMIDVPAETSVALPALSLPRQAVVEGRITEDGTGRPVKGAVVRVESEEDSFARYTDADGRYQVGGIVAGTYRITVETYASCLEDEDWVDEGWVDDRSGEGQEVTLAAGDRLDVSAGLACDYDHDAMGDGWETANGLDPHRDDRGLDPDGDGVDNGEEYVAGTNPRDQARASGCATAPGSVAWGGAVALALLARARRQGLVGRRWFG